MKVVMTNDMLKKEHQDLRDLGEQIVACQDSFDTENYQKSKALLAKYKLQAEHLDQYNNLFKMNLLDFEKAFDKACKTLGCCAKISTRAKPVTCTEAKDYAGTPIYDYTIPIDYFVIVRKLDKDGGTTLTENYRKIKLLTAKHYLRINAQGEYTEDCIAQLQEEANTATQLKYININLLTNSEFHLGSYMDMATAGEIDGVSLDDVLWLTFANKINQDLDNRKRQIQDNISELATQNEQLGKGNIDYLLSDEGRNLNDAIEMQLAR